MKKDKFKIIRFVGAVVVVTLLWELLTLNKYFQSETVLFIAKSAAYGLAFVLVQTLAGAYKNKA